MKFKISSNRKNNLMVLIFNNGKHFDISKIVDLLHINKATICLESENISDILESNHYEIKNHYELYTNQIFMSYLTNDFYTLVKLFMTQKNVSNILIVDQKYFFRDDLSIIQDIKNNNVRCFIDIDLGENQVHVFINTVSYPQLTRSKIIESLNK